VRIRWFEVVDKAGQGWILERRCLEVLGRQDARSVVHVKGSEKLGVARRRREKERQGGARDVEGSEEWRVWGRGGARCGRYWGYVGRRVAREGWQVWVRGVSVWEIRDR
jgi:hypothetical protein